MMKYLFATLLALAVTLPAEAEARPVVVELYTSQGCSSCPPADALLAQLAADPSLLALSFHVHYWDYLGWKDPFSSPENTRRQRVYAQRYSGGTPYTPQMVVDGAAAMVGSDAQKVRAAIAQAKKEMMAVPISMTSNAAGQLEIAIGGNQPNIAPGNAHLWEIRFNRKSVTPIAAGENRGRTIESANNVMRIKDLGIWQNAPTAYRIPLSELTEDGVAVILQDDAQGRVLGAGVFLKGS